MHWTISSGLARSGDTGKSEKIGKNREDWKEKVRLARNQKIGKNEKDTGTAGLDTIGRIGKNRRHWKTRERLENEV